MKKSTETISGCGEVGDSKEFIPVMCEVCITLETTKPAASLIEFLKPVNAVESAHLRPLISESAQTSKNEAETERRPKKYCVSSSGNQAAQESTSHNSSVNKLSEINKKGSSVAAILSMFTEKAEQERRRFERRPSRPVRTFRDVEKPSSRKSSLVVTHENEGNYIKLYRAPEEEKNRVKNLIELHRRGSADQKQVDRKEIVAMKKEEGSKGFSGQEVRISEQGEVEMIGKKVEINPALNAKKGTEWSKEKVAVSGLTISESTTVKKTGQVTEERSTDTMTVAKTSHVRNETKKQKKDGMELTTNQKTAERIERPAENVILVNALQVLASQQKTMIQDDSSTSRSRKIKNWVKLNESQNDSSLKQLKHAKSNSDKQIETVNENRDLSSEPCLSEERCTPKKEVAGNVNNQNVPKRGKNKVENRNPDIKDAAQKLVQLKNSEKVIEYRDSSGRKEMKENVEKLKKGTALTELVETPSSFHYPHKAKKMKPIEENKNKIQKPISTLQPPSADSEENHTDKLLQRIVPKEPPKAAGISGRKKVIGETKVKKPQDKRGSEVESISSALKNGETISSVQKKLSNSRDGALHLIQDTVSSVQESVGVFPNSRTPINDAVNSKVSRKNSCSKNLLMRMKSEINLAEDEEKKKSVRTRRKAVDDQAVFDKKRDKSQRSISVRSS